MMPPNCCLCERGLDTNDNCELVAFAKRPEDIQWYRAIEASGETGHPPNVDWFCASHVAGAREIAHLTIDEALAQLRGEAAWSLELLDLFDHSPGMPIDSGRGLEQGLAKLWHHVLSVTDETGRRSGTDYRVCWQHAGNPEEVCIPRRPNEGLARLRQWFQDEDTRRRLVNVLGRAHAGLVRQRTPGPRNVDAEAEKILVRIANVTDSMRLESELRNLD